VSTQVLTEKRIGNKLFHIVSECSSSAKETVEQKLERLICRHASDAKSYPTYNDTSLAMSEIVREHASTTIRKE